MELKRKSKVFHTVPFVWSKTLWVMTFAVFALWIGFSGFLAIKIIAEPDPMEYVVSLVTFNLIFIPLIIICEGLAPQRLEIGEDGIVILRRYKSVVIERQEIKSVSYLPPMALRRSIRTCGVGGLFGYYGHHYSPALGSFMLYATTFENLYLIKKWDGKSIVISCAEPDKIESFL